MTPKKNQTWQNVTTDMLVTILSINESDMYGNVVEYEKEEATGPERSSRSELVNAGFKENVKPLYVFMNSYVFVKN